MRRTTAALIALLLLALPFGSARAGEEDDPVERAALVAKLRGFVREALDEIDADPQIAALRSLGRLRDELDHRRDRALLAIFHPTAPAHTLGRETRQALQRVVERRVAAVSEIWNVSRKAELSQQSGIRETLRQLERLFGDLERLGDKAPRLRAAAGILPTYWHRREITIRDYFRTQAEEAQQDYDRWVTGFYNEARKADGPSETREQARLTNEHRRMLGYAARVKAAAPIAPGMDETAILKTLAAATLVERTPLRALRIDKRLATSAMGHARRMAQHGFLAHMTPARFAKPGIRSPGERIAAAGYKAGGMAENVAAGPKSAAGAHQVWRREPAKHRILLGPWTDIGVGHVDGRWVQNFAAGDGGPQTKQPDVRPRRGSR